MTTSFARHNSGRDGAELRRFDEYVAEVNELARRIGRPVQFMEVCGTHTVSIFRSGIRSMLPSNVKMLSGPGCPVCVTAQRHIDAAIELAARRDVVLATYGDMMRVPGRLGSLEKLRSTGASVQVVASASGALQRAEQTPDADVVFLAVGFETTAPATAAVILEAEQRGIENFSILACHKLVVPAMRALLLSGETALDGFLCPGHVSVIIGAEAYRPIAEGFGKPCVVAGFEPRQIVAGLAQLLRQVAQARAELENVYSAVVSPAGNATAMALMQRVFEPADTAWRELGVIPLSGLSLRPCYRRFDAVARFGLTIGQDVDNPACRCGEVIVGRSEPRDCPLFAGGCTPLNPIGPCMVSSEGTCAAWFKYGRARPQGGHDVDGEPRFGLRNPQTDIRNPQFTEEATP